MLHLASSHLVLRGPGQSLSQNLSSIHCQLPGHSNVRDRSPILRCRDLHPDKTARSRHPDNMQPGREAGRISKHISLHDLSPHSLRDVARVATPYHPSLLLLLLIFATSRANSICAATRSRLASEILAYTPVDWIDRCPK